MKDQTKMLRVGQLIVPGITEGPVLACSEGLSFWGGVDARSGVIIDAHHEQCGQSLAGRIVLMPTSRGSCSGSGVLLELALIGQAPAALVFCEDENILTLGALITTKMFDKSVVVLRLWAEDYAALAEKSYARITDNQLEADGLSLPLAPLSDADLRVSDADRSMLDGVEGEAAKLAMETLCTMAVAQGAERLTDMTRGHIDGCIYASPANLLFAERMAEMGGQVRIPTTMNAISVDHANWRNQGVPADFGLPASRLADAYVRMGAQPCFTCAPYQSKEAPRAGEDIGWSESNAVIYANSVLGARTEKHPDFLDLFIALTGRAPLSGVYLEANRAARIVIKIQRPNGMDDAFWPVLGWLAGLHAPDRIPLITGLEDCNPGVDDLRATCAAFGTTSAAPMLHIAGVTPEGNRPPAPEAGHVRLSRTEFTRAWQDLNTGPETIDLVALGSPHFSLNETRQFAALMEGRTRHAETSVIITLSRETAAAAEAEGLRSKLERKGVRLISDLCWCSISEPVFPPDARTIMTNSGKYAHYAPGLSGRSVRFGNLEDCAKAAEAGTARKILPDWLS